MMARRAIPMACAWATCAALAMGLSPVKHPLFPPDYGPEQIEALRFGAPTPKYVPHSLWCLYGYDNPKRLGTADAMLMTPAELAAMVPDKAGIMFAGCPNCDGGAQENQVVRWEMGLGDRVRCQYCGMIFPNEKYPENHALEIIAPSGKKQAYRWHEDANGRQFFLEARAWFDRCFWAQIMANRLANLYHYTGNEEYALRAAAIIGRFAQVLPDYAMHFDQPFRPRLFFPADQKHPYEGARSWNVGRTYHYAYCDIPDVLAMAYDLIASSDAFEKLHDLLGDDIRERIERDLMRMSYDFTAVRPDDYSNMAPGMYHDMMVVGRLLDDPAIVHDTIERVGTLLRKNFFADGWWHEGATSYHNQVVKSLDDVDRVSRGYSDPPGREGARHDNLELSAALPMLARARRVTREAVLPDGREIPFNDTWSDWKIAPTTQSTSLLWPGMGHGVLGAGRGEAQFQAHLHWSGNFGHSHMDKASIILFAHGREMLSDIGYTHTRYRNWSVNTASHNTVVIDERSQAMGTDEEPATGNLLFFDDAGARVQVLDLDARPAYPQSRTYRRRLIHVHADEGRDYVVDRFDVAGGTTHDYFLHGDANMQGTMTTSLALEQAVASLTPAWGRVGEYRSENDVDLKGDRLHAYGFMKEIKSGAARGAMEISWRYGAAGLRTHLAAPEGGTIYRFVAPAIRGAGRDDSKLNDYWREGIMARHAGGESRFVAVHEPFGDAPWLDAVEFERDRVIVRRGGAVDTITFAGEQYRVESSAGWSYDSGAPRGGAVEQVTRHGERVGIVLDQAAPGARAVRLTFGNGRSQTHRVAKAEGKTLWLADDPGFDYDPAATSLTFANFPQRTISGRLSYTVYAAEGK